MKINCVIVEDEPKAMSLIEDYVHKTPFLTLVSSFYISLHAMQFLSENKNIDLVFLDINMPELTGIDLAQVIDSDVKIIFTTAHADFAVRSYEVNTIDYLLKPITYHRFFQAVLKAKKIIEAEKLQSLPNQPQSHFFVKSGKKIIQVNWSEIYYIEALKEYMSIVTEDEKILVYKRMAEFENIKPRSFRRVHNSFIINLDKIDKVEDNIVFINNKEIPISKTYKDDFFSTIRDRLI
jgi:DNA-binding LytR/AlgR family response regulator